MSDRLTLSLPEAAELLGLTSDQLYELTRNRSRVRSRNPLPYLKLGKRLAFRRASLEQWIAAQEAAQLPEGGAR